MRGIPLRCPYLYTIKRNKSVSDFSCLQTYYTREKANAVYCSHKHGDHCGEECIEIIPDPKSPFTVTKISTYHDNQMGRLRGKNVIFIIEDGEHRIAHLGDLGCSLTKEQINQLTALDAVMMPVGGFYTINAMQAAEIMEQIKPRMAIPMHYRITVDGISYGYSEIDDVSGFLEDLDSLITLSGSEVDTSNIPAKVVVLQPKNR